MILTLYRFLTLLLAPLIRLWLHYRLRKGKEDGERLHERFGLSRINRPAGQLIWVHAASVGESNSVLPLIELLAARAPDIHLLITTGTVTSARHVEKRLPERTMHQFVPVDTPNAVRLFLNHWQPNAAIWVESEFWPNLMQETCIRRIPMTLINARMSDRSYLRWQRYRATFLQLMSCFSHAYAGSMEDLEKFHQLGLDSMRYVGNLKYDAPPLAADPKELERLRQAVAHRTVWLAASTHAGEEALIADIHQTLRKTYSNLLTIIVPRHAHRGAAVAQELHGLRLHICCRSKQELPDANTDIYLADTMGELGIFYRLCQVVVIGGSLLPIGGHNPIEPAQLGCAILCGPHMDNFVGICEELSDAGGLVQTRDVPTLRMLIDYWLANPKYPEEHAEKALQATAKHTGVATTLATDILASIPHVAPDTSRGAA